MEHTMGMFAGGGTVTAYCTGCGWISQASKSEDPNFPTADWQAHLETVKKEFLERLGDHMQGFKDQVDFIFSPKEGKRQ